MGEFHYSQGCQPPMSSNIENSSLYCCQLFQHDGVQQESSCYFGHCTQLNLMPFSLMIIYQPLCSPTYVHFCKCLIQCEIKEILKKTSTLLSLLFSGLELNGVVLRSIYSISKKGLSHSDNFVIISRFP